MLITYSDKDNAQQLLVTDKDHVVHLLDPGKHCAGTLPGIDKDNGGGGLRPNAQKHRPYGSG